jgi:O-antigen/teichoic acid export membrane protein
VSEKQERGRLKKAAMQGAVWSILQYGGNRLIGLVVFVCLARLLSPETWGVMAALQAFVLIGELIMEQGLGYALVQRKEVAKEHFDTVFWVQVIIAIITSLVGFIFAPQFVSWFLQPDLVHHARIIMITPVITALGAVHQAILMRNLQFKQLAGRQLVANTSGGVVAILLALSGVGVWSLIAQQVITSVMSTVTLWLANPWRPGRMVKLSALGQLANFSINLFVHRGLLVVSNHLGRLLVASVLGPISLGLYVSALRIVETIIVLFVNPFKQLALPVLSKLQNSPEGMRRGYAKALQVTSMFSFPAAVGISMLSPQIVIIFLGDKWTEATPFLAILALLVIAKGVGGATSSILLASGASFKRMLVVASYTLLKLILLVLFVERGLFVVCAIHVLCQMITIPIYDHMIRSELKMQILDYVKIIGPIALATIGMALGIHLLSLTWDSAVVGLWVFGAKVAIGGMFYLCLLCLLSRSSRIFLQEMLFVVLGQLGKIYPRLRRELM